MLEQQLAAAVPAAVNWKQGHSCLLCKLLALKQDLAGQPDHSTSMCAGDICAQQGLSKSLAQCTVRVEVTCAVYCAHKCCTACEAVQGGPVTECSVLCYAVLVM